MIYWDTMILSVIIAALLSGLIVLGVLAFTPVSYDSRKRPSVTRFVLWLLLSAMLAAASSFALGPLGFLVAVAVAGMIIRYKLVSRDSLTLLLFSTIAASMRQNLPLPTALQAEASGQQGKRRLALSRTADWLAEGFPLSEAIGWGLPQCPGYALAMVAAAERMNQSPQAVAAVADHLVYRSREGRKLQPVQPAYPLAVILVAFCVLTALLVFVVPKFRDIFSDMGAPLPAITLVVFAGAIMFQGWLVAVVLFFSLGVVPMSVYLLFRPRRPGEPYLVSQIGDVVKWHLPILHWFERNYALQQTVTFLLLSLRAGAPLNEAVSAAADLDVNLIYRRRLNNWLKAIEQGRDAAGAARTCGVGSTLAWAFDQQVNPGNAPAVLESIESATRSNYSYLANLARFILWPCTTIALAGLVGALVYAMFAPLVGLIEYQVRMAMP